MSPSCMILWERISSGVISPVFADSRSLACIGSKTRFIRNAWKGGVLIFSVIPSAGTTRIASSLMYMFASIVPIEVFNGTICLYSTGGVGRGGLGIGVGARVGGGFVGGFIGVSILLKLFSARVELTISIISL